MGYTTGIDLEAVAAISMDMQQWLGAPLPGLLYSLLQNKEVRLN
jgi:hypothetical protein